MCDEVCYCCEKDLCKCPNFKPNLQDIIFDVMNLGSTLPYKKSEIHRYSSSEFYLYTHKSKNTYLNHTKIGKEIEKLGYKIRCSSIEHDKTNSEWHIIYKFNKSS